MSSYPVPLSARCSGSSMSRGLPVTAFVSSMTRVTLLTKTSLCDDRGGVDDDVFVELKENISELISQFRKVESLVKIVRHIQNMFK